MRERERFAAAQVNGLSFVDLILDGPIARLDSRPNARQRREALAVHLLRGMLGAALVWRDHGGAARIRDRLASLGRDGSGHKIESSRTVRDRASPRTVSGHTIEARP